MEVETEMGNWKSPIGKIESRALMRICRCAKGFSGQMGKGGVKVFNLSTFKDFIGMMNNLVKIGVFGK